MTAAAVLDALKKQGATVTLNGDKVRIEPAQVLTGELRDYVKSFKPEIVELLDLEKRSRSTPTVTAADRQTERIRRLARDVTAEELSAAHKLIRPTLRRELNAADLMEIALFLAVAAKKTEAATRPARTFDAGLAFIENHIEKGNDAKRN